MATFTTANNRFEGSFTLTKQSGSTLDLPLSGQYVDKNIHLTLNVRNASAAANTASADATIYTTDGSNGGINISSVIGTKATSEPTTGYYIAITASATGNSKITQSGWIESGALPAATASVTKYFPINTATFTYSGGILNNTSATTTFDTNIITANSDTGNNGLKITPVGAASRTTATYTNTAGYIPAHDSAQTALDSVNITTWTGTDCYLTGVKLEAPSSGTAQFSITVPNGNIDDFITFVFSVDSTGNVTVAGPD